MIPSLNPPPPACRLTSHLQYLDSDPCCLDELDDSSWSAGEVTAQVSALYTT